MKKFFDKDLPKKCEYCTYATLLGNSDELICKLRGIVNSQESCRKYKYDPLKRVPNKQKISDNYSPDDFII